MGKNKKSNNKGPRRKRLKSEARLQSAKHWLTTYSGNNVTKGYKNWFGVSWQCAIIELKRLGVKLDQQYIDQVLKSASDLIIARQKQKIAKQKKQQELDDLLCDSDEEYYYIAGYTSGGFPYGVKWEELTQEEQNYFRNDSHKIH